MEDLDLTTVEKEVIRHFIAQARESSIMVLIGPADLAKVMEFSRPRAYAILSKLEEKNIVTKMDRKGYYLSPKGIDVKNVLQHRSKVMETYFVEKLGMDLEMAEVEAQSVVLYVSQHLIDILCYKLGQPKTCPHNYIIPHDDEN